MPFSEIIEKSFKYPWKNRTLWFYGILLAIFAGGSSFSNSNSLSQEDINKITSGFKNIPNVPAISSATWVVIGAVAVILIAGFTILGLIISSWAITAINRGTEILESGKKIERKGIGKTGGRVVWKMILLNLFIPFGIALAIIILVLLGVLIFIAIPKPFGLVAGIFTGVVAFFAFLAGVIYLSVIWPVAIRFVTNESKNAFESIKSAIALIKEKKKFWLTLGFNIVMNVITSMGMFVALIPMIIIIVGIVGFIIAKIYVGAIVCGVLALLYLLPLLIAEGYFQSFTHTGQTIWWLELKKLKK